MAVLKPQRRRTWIKVVIGLAVILIAVLVILMLAFKPAVDNLFAGVVSVTCQYDVHVIVFADGNGNGVQDSGESGIAGAKVTLDHHSQVQSYHPTPGQVTTDSTGITDLAENDYCYPQDTFTVNVTPPAGYTATTPLSFGPYLASGYTTDGLTQAVVHPIPRMFYVGLRKN